MAFEIEFYELAERKLLKLGKKNRPLLAMVKAKLKQIAESPFHFKPLRAPMQGLRRVHIGDSFVLVYEIDEKRNAVVVVDVDHHDKIYE